MNRNKIRLYNTDKYQAVLPAPEIEELEGDAQEVIISADGREDSASGESISSVTFNASGGIWYDTGIKTSYVTFSSIQDTNITKICELDMSMHRAASLTICLYRNASVRMVDVSVVHDGQTAVEIDQIDRTSIGQDITKSNFFANISNNTINITCETDIGTQVQGVVNSFVY